MYTEKYWTSWVESYELFALGGAFAVKFTNVHHVLFLWFPMFYLASSIRYWPCVCFSGCPTFIKNGILVCFQYVFCAPLIHPYLTTQPTRYFEISRPHSQCFNTGSKIIQCPYLCTTIVLQHNPHKGYLAPGREVIPNYRLAHLAISSWYIWLLGYILGYIHTRAIINIEMIREDMRVIDHPADRPMWR